MNFNLIIQISLLIQSIIIILFSVVILQNVLKNSSTEFRLAFISFPIGASFGIVDVFTGSHFYFSRVIINLGVILILKWFWIHKDTIKKFSKELLSDESKKNSFLLELKVIICYFGMWLVHITNQNTQLTCEICKNIIEKNA